MPAYPNSDECYRQLIARQVEAFSAHLTNFGVRYEDSEKSKSAKRVRWYPRMFEGAMQNASSLVMMK